MAEYEVTRGVPVVQEIAFDTAARPDRLHAWLPDALEAEVVDESTLRVRVRGDDRADPVEGTLDVRKDELRLQWRSRDGAYSAWLQFRDAGAGTSEAVCHVSIGGAAPAGVEQEMEAALDRLVRQVGHLGGDASLT